MEVVAEVGMEVVTDVAMEVVVEEEQVAAAEVEAKEAPCFPRPRRLCSW